MRLDTNRIGGFVMLMFFAAYWAASLDIRVPVYMQSATFTAQSMPQAYAIGGIVLSVLLLLVPSGKTLSFERSNLLPVVLICILMLIYSAIIRLLGFLPATTLFLMAGIYLRGERRWSVLLGVAIPVAAVFWFLLAVLLGAHLPPWPTL